MERSICKTALLFVCLSLLASACQTHAADGFPTEIKIVAPDGRSTKIYSQPDIRSETLDTAFHNETLEVIGPKDDFVEIKLPGKKLSGFVLKTDTAPFETPTKKAGYSDWILLSLVVVLVIGVGAFILWKTRKQTEEAWHSAGILFSKTTIVILAAMAAMVLLYLLSEINENKEIVQELDKKEELEKATAERQRLDQLAEAKEQERLAQGMVYTAQMDDVCRKKCSDYVANWKKSTQSSLPPDLFNICMENEKSVMLIRSEADIPGVCKSNCRRSYQTFNLPTTAGAIEECMGKCIKGQTDRLRKLHVAQQQPAVAQREKAQEETIQKVPIRSLSEVGQRQQLLGRYAREAGDISDMLSGQAKQKAFNELIQRFSAEDWPAGMTDLFAKWVGLQDRLTTTGVPAQEYPKGKRLMEEAYSHLLDGCQY